jgi:hypothetical protein
MRDDYPIHGDKKKIELELEQKVVERLEKMTGYTKLSASEIVNTAMKRFILTHKDFLPPADRKFSI